MSYRTKINGFQIFGNNECYQEWLEFIASQGIRINKEGHYKGEITDFMAALKVIEQITLNIHTAREQRISKIKQTNYTGKLRGIFDFTNIPAELDAEESDEFGTSLFDKIKDTIDNGYAFLPYQFFKACEPCLEPDDAFHEKKHLHCYKIKPGCKIKIEAY